MTSEVYMLFKVYICYLKLHESFKETFENFQSFLYVKNIASKSIFSRYTFHPALLFIKHMSDRHFRV